MRSVKVIECNVRASRTVPFISKTLNVNFIELAMRVMMGYKVKPVQVHLLEFDFIACKVPMFSFLRLRGSDPRVGVEMQSTGEVACFGRDALEAFLKGCVAGGLKLPTEGAGVLVSLGSPSDKKAFLPHLQLLAEMGHVIYATSGTAEFLQSVGFTSGKVTVLHKATTKREPNVNSSMREKKVELVINTPSSRESGGATAGYFLRRGALDAGLSLVVDLRQAMMLVDALHQKQAVERQGGEFWTIESWQRCHRLG